jgi:hypothetical protein
MSDTKYNGWTNYATWRINLEMFDCVSLDDLNMTGLEAYELGEALKDYAEEILSTDTDNHSLVYSYAMAFISDVNWYEIAEHLIDAYAENEAYNERGAIV